MDRMQELMYQGLSSSCLGFRAEGLGFRGLVFGSSYKKDGNCNGEMGFHVQASTLSGMRVLGQARYEAFIPRPISWA